MAAKNKSSLFKIYLFLGIMGIVVISIISFSLYTGNRITAQYTPLIDAAMEIKLEATTAHRWFEKILSGDREEDMETVWKHIDNSEWYARAMLEGGENPEGVFIPLDKAELQDNIKVVLQEIETFRQYTKLRFESREFSGAGTEIDQRYDAQFNILIQKADEVETSLQQIIVSDLQKFHFTQLLLIVISVVFFLITGIILKRYERRRTTDFLTIQSVNENLEKEIGERKTLSRHFNYLTRYANDIILLMNNDGKIVEANERALKAYGYKLDEFLNLNIENLQAPDSHSDVAQLMQKIEEKNGLIFEVLHQRKDGSTFPVEVSARRMEIEGKYYFQSIVRDITEKKQAEEKLNKSNRLYATLSQVNQAIVRERDKQKLLQEICDIAIEYGKFRLAWIGFVDEESKLVKPAAFSGEGSDYLQNIEVSVNDGLTGRGPSGRSIREGKSVVFNDLKNNPDFAPWREQALEKGYRSSASFPIRLNNIVIGTFGIYAVETHFFDQDEVKLLEEAAMDISFALEKFKEEEERIRAEEALRESEERWQFALKGSRDGVWDWNAVTNEVFFSRRWKEMLGYNEDEISNHLDEWDKRVHPDDKEQCYADLSKHISGETPFYENEHRVLCKDGSYKWILDRGKVISWTEDKKPLRVIGTHTDITERMKAEEALQESEEKYRLLADNSIDVIWQTDLKLVFTYVSPSIENFMGYTVDEWVGSKLSQHSSRKEFFNMSKKALYAIKNYKKFKHLTFDAVMLRKDGTEIPVEITGKLLLNKKRLPIGLQGTTRDITERKQAEEELAKHREHLEELVKERTTDLEKKNAELKRYNKLFAGREFRIKELREKVKELERKK